MLLGGWVVAGEDVCEAKGGAEYCVRDKVTPKTIAMIHKDRIDGIQQDLRRHQIILWSGIARTTAAGVVVFCSGRCASSCAISPLTTYALGMIVGSNVDITDAGVVANEVTDCTSAGFELTSVSV